MSNVRILPGFGPRDPDAILSVAQNAGLSDVIVIGWTGEDFFVSRSHEAPEKILWDLECAKLSLFSE